MRQLSSNKLGWLDKIIRFTVAPVLMLSLMGTIFYPFVSSDTASAATNCSVSQAQCSDLESMLPEGELDLVETPAELPNGINIPAEDLESSVTARELIVLLQTRHATGALDCLTEDGNIDDFCELDKKSNDSDYTQVQTVLNDVASTFKEAILLCAYEFGGAAPKLSKITTCSSSYASITFRGGPIPNTDLNYADITLKADVFPEIGDGLCSYQLLANGAVVFNVGEQGFVSLGNCDDDVTPQENAEDAEVDVCLNADGGNFIGWIACPAIDFINIFLVRIEGRMQEMLRFDLDTDPSDGNTANSGNQGVTDGVKDAWNTFRLMSTLIVVVGFLLALVIKAIKG